MTQPLEVVPFPTAPGGRAVVEQLLHLGHVAVAPAGGGPRDVMEVALTVGLAQGLRELCVRRFQARAVGQGHARPHHRQRRHGADGEQRRSGGPPPGPDPRPLQRPHPPCLDRLVGQEPPQVLPQRLGRRVTILRVLGARLQDDRLPVAGNARVERARPRRVLGLDPLDELEPVGRLERRPERDQLVEGQAQGVDVGAAVGLAAEPLGGHVAERAQDVAGLGQAIVARLGQPEVSDPDDSLGVEQQVRRLDVAVDDPPRMGVGQPRRHLPADLGHAAKERPPARLDRRELRPARQHHRRGRTRLGDRDGVARRRGVGLIRIAPIGQSGRRLPVRNRSLGFSRPPWRLGHEPAGQQRVGHPADLPRPRRSGRRRPRRDRRVRPFGRAVRSGPMRPLLEPTQLVDDRVQPLALDELHGIVADLAILADLEDRHDIRVVELGRRAGLAAEAGQGLGVLGHLAGQDLQSHVTPQRDLLGLVDDAHAALADFAEDAKITKLLQGRRRRRGGARGSVLVVFPNLLDLDHSREQLADVVRQLGIAIDVLLKRRPFAGPVPRGELVGEPSQQDVVGGALRGLLRHCRVLRAWWRGQP
jgi:hypothetical protein